MASTTPGTARVTVNTGPEWKRVAAALDAEDKALGDKFRREVREAGNMLAARAQAAVMRIPSTGLAHSGLRARVAHGVGTKITASGVDITTSMNDRDETNLPAYLDSQSGWRHPVFGNRDVWVRQDTGGSWFRATIESGRNDVEDRLSEIMDGAARTISRAGTGR